VKRELQQAEASAAQFGLDRLKCQLRAQRAHVETIFGGTIRDALRYARHAARIAARLEDSELSSVARFVLGLAFLFAGEYQAAAEVLSVDRAAYVHGLRITAVGSSGTLAVDGLAVFGDALGHLGCCEEALALGAEAKAVAAQTGNPWDMHVANYHLARTHLAHCDPTSALELIASNIDFGERCGLPMVVQWHYALLGQVNLQRGRYEEAIEWLDRAIIGCAPMKLRWTMSLALLAKAEALIAAGRLDMAERPAMEAFRLARRHGYKAFEAGARQALAACMRERDIAEFSAAH
jgi:tetratricopeptide (TPR) repeat protein